MSNNSQSGPAESDKPQLQSRTSELDSFSSSEFALWKAFSVGEELDLSDSNPSQNDLKNGKFWGPERTIRSEVIARILLDGPKVVSGVPVRLRVSGARISGVLDLGCAKIPPFLFTKCYFDESPFCNDSTAEFFGLSNCHLPGVTAQRLQCTGPLWMQGCTVSGKIDLENASIRRETYFRDLRLSGEASSHALCLCGSTLGSDLVLERASIDGTVGIVGSKIDGGVILSKARINGCNDVAITAIQSEIKETVYASSGLECKGKVSFEGARISGMLDFRNARLANPNSLAFDLDHAQIALGLAAVDMKVEGSIFMHHAQIGCQVSLAKAAITACEETALRADHVVVDGTLTLSDAKYDGEVRLHGAEISCNLDLDDARIVTKKSIAVAADGLSVGRNLLMRRSEVTGETDISGSEIKGSAVFSGSTMRQTKSFALDARRVRVGGSLVINDKFASRGRVAIADATIGVTFEFNDATLANQNDVALDLAGASVQGDVIGDRSDIDGLLDLTYIRAASDVRIADANLRGTALRSSSLGTPLDRRRGGPWRGISLRASAASVDGDIDLRGTTFTHSLMMHKLTAGRSILLSRATLGADDTAALDAEGLIANQLRLELKSKPAGEINLTEAKIGVLFDADSSWPANANLRIDGFNYRELGPTLSLDQRLRWLEQATPIYSPQPYEQLAKFYDASGRIDAARQVRREALKRAYKSRGIPFNILGRIQDLVLGFGYLPARAAVIFLALWLSSSAWYEWGVSRCVRFGVTWHSICPVQPTSHLTWNPLLYSLDLLVPVLDLGYGKSWDPVGVSKAISVALVICGWILTTTIVASVARALRRSE